MHWISPRANAGFSIFAASIDPEAEPAPTIVWISSIKRMIFGFFDNSFKIALIRSSNCPRYFVPATIEAISKLITRLSNNTRETLRWIMRKANPSTMADLPTPGSPINTGLFFFLRLNIWAKRSISFSRPTIGSRRFSAAARVISVPKLSRTGVSLGDFGWAAPAPAPEEGRDASRREEKPSSSSSSSSSVYPSLISSNSSILFKLVPLTNILYAER